MRTLEDVVEYGLHDTILLSLNLSIEQKTIGFRKHDDDQIIEITLADLESYNLDIHRDIINQEIVLDFEVEDDVLSVFSTSNSRYVMKFKSSDVDIKNLEDSTRNDK